MVTTTSTPSPLAENAPAAEAGAGAKRRRRGLLRYNADVWSLLWLHAGLAVSLLPWFVPMKNWQLMLLGLPVFFFRSSVAYLQHNQGHLPAFWSKALNFVYDIELALMSGYVTPLWELQHARGHHRHYLTPAKDPARIVDMGTGKVMARWWYCVRGNFTIIQDSWRIAAQEKAENRADIRPRMVAEFLVAGALAGLLLYLNWWAWLWFILVPNLLVAFGVWWVSWAHHHEVASTSHYDGSHSHLGHSFNRLTFNIGHHAAHHEKPTLHWSLLPQRTAQILTKLDTKLVHGELEPEVKHLVAQPAPASEAALRERLAKAG